MPGPYPSRRHQRQLGHVPTEEFLDSWGDGDNSFADDPPNAVLSIFSEDQVNDVVVVLQDPVLDGVKFIALGHNTIRGAAGCGVLNAEYLKIKKIM